MSVALLTAIGGLVAVGTYLVTARSLSRIVLGFSMLGHATVLGLLVAGGRAGDAPLADTTTPDESANPLPQALALTAIVISFGLTLFLLGLARRQRVLSGDDLVEDDLEDRRVARAVEDEDRVDAVETLDAADAADAVGAADAVDAVGGGPRVEDAT
jgi:multicomponent Na+:H+ antiporter subunit C